MCTDTIYSRGEFPLSYKHITLEDIHAGKPPLLLGPVLVHQYERGLQHAASSDNSAWSVQSFSSPVPHSVTCKESGQFMCDPQCPQWVSLKICSHTFAVVGKMGQLPSFLQWTYQQVNVNLLNMPKG